MNKIDRATAATTSDEVDTNDQKSKKYDSDPTFDIKFETDHVEHLDSAQRLDDNELLFNENLVRAEAEDKMTPFLAFLILTAALAGFLWGYDTGIVGSALPMVGTDLGHVLSDGESEIITAATTIGAIFGALILGTLSDKIGRKLSMVVADIAFTIGAVIIAASYWVPMIIIGRLILGVGVGSAAVIAPLYISELAPTAMRGRCVGVNAFFIPFGQVCASAISIPFKNVKHNWRILFALGVVPSLLQLILMHFLPESPRIMAARGERERAKAILRKVYGSATDEVIDLKLRVIDVTIREMSKLNTQYTFRERVKVLWTHKPYRRAIIAVSGMQAFGQLTGYNSLLYYSGTLFGLLGFSNAAIAGLIPSGGNALCVFIGSSIVDKVGRRRLVLVAVPFLIAGQIWAAIAFHFMTKDTNSRLDASYQYSTASVGSVIGAICLVVVAFGFSLSHVIWHQSEFLALEIRAAGSAIATTSCWLANLVISVSYLSLMNKLTPTGTYGLYAGFCVAGFVFTIFCYPETKGLSVDQTSTLFQDDYGIKKSRVLRDEKALLVSQYKQGNLEGGCA